MKKMITVTLSAVMLLSCLTGCKQHEIPAQASEAVTATPAAITPYQTPERFTGSWTGVDGCVKVTADAVVAGPGDTSIPVAKVKRHKFTLEDADKLKEVFLQGSTLYQFPEEMTRQEVENTLEVWRELQRGEREPDGPKTPEQIADAIAHYEELLKTAPEVAAQIPADTFVSTREGVSEITGTAKIGEDEVYLSIINSDHDDWSDSAVFFVMPYYPGNYFGGGGINAARLGESPYPTDVKLPLHEAIRTGRELLEQLGLTGRVCSVAEPVAYVRQGQVMDTGYELYFVRTVQGLPLNVTRETTYTPEGFKELTMLRDGSSSAKNNPNPEWWCNERICIRVSTRGIVAFEWYNPYEEPELVTGQAELLDFETVSQIFEKMIMVRNSEMAEINLKNGSDDVRELNVDSVNFTLMRIREKGNLSQGTIVPVWDFWGTEKWYEADKDAYGGTRYMPLLTINALVGSIIDREIGY